MFQAICLLLALLQGGNRQVQETMTIALKSPKYASFFASISHVLESTVKTLKEYKRKNASKFSGKSKTRRTASADEGWAEGEVEGIGRRSHVMLTLRLLQLMCAKQYAPLQDLMLKQSRSSSVNVLRQMLELFSSSQVHIFCAACAQVLFVCIGSQTQVPCVRTIFDQIRVPWVVWYVCEDAYQRNAGSISA